MEIGDIVNREKLLPLVHQVIDGDYNLFSDERYIYKVQPVVYGLLNKVIDYAHLDDGKKQMDLFEKVNDYEQM